MALNYEYTHEQYEAERRRWAKALLWVIAQYCDKYVKLDKNHMLVSFEHQCMSAGEDATDMLEDLGLVKDQGYLFELTDAGRELMESDDD